MDRQAAIDRARELWPQIAAAIDQHLARLRPDDVRVAAPATGEVLVTLAPDDTAGRSGLYRHECEIIDTNGKPYTVLRGLIEIVRGYL